MNAPRIRPSLRLLRIFQAVVDQNSFGAAAQCIGVSQPAVSQSIKRLETLLGATLLDRRRTACGASELGAILHVRTQRLFRQIELALSEPQIGAPFADARRAANLAQHITECQMRALVAIDQAGSFANAARRLDAAEPSIQRAARDLERILRRPLYTRSMRGLTTTRAGSELARRWQLALREIDDALDEIEGARGASTARLSVGALPLSCSALLATTINDLTEEFPKARIAISEAAYEPLLQQLRSGRIDILFGVLRQSDCVADVAEQSLFCDAYAIVVRRSHPLASKKGKIGIDDLARYEWLAPTGAVPRRQAIEALFAGGGHTPHIAVETHSLPTQKALLAVSDRITLLTRREADFEARGGLFAILEFDGLVPRRPDGLATRSDWRPTALQRRFIELMEVNARSLVPA